jgi:leader peptidase (prepilin peptidase) / N-methyltransferase
MSTTPTHAGIGRETLPAAAFLLVAFAILPALLFLAVLPFSAGLALALGVGLATGGALDIVFERFYREEDLRGALYRCSRCRAPLRPLLAVPLLGALTARMRCPDCRQPLPLRALILPGGSTALFALSYLVFREPGAALLGGFFAAVFLTLTLTDLERRLLPNRIIYPAIVLAAAFSWGWPDTSVAQVFIGAGVAVAVAAAIFLLSLPFGTDAYGMGDVKMILLIGFVAGWPGVLVGVFLGTIAAGVAAAFLIATRLRSRRDYIPKGPFLALGGVLALFWGHELWPY